VSDPPDLNVFITRLEAGGDRRVGVKDLFDTAGIRTTYGSKIFADHVPDADAEAVRRLREAGWTMAGKTNLHEFAYGATSDNPWYGPVRNPHDPGRVAGGSSGGSASGLVTGDFELGLGTDTGGSIRIPAALCGVVGYKPQHGAVPLDGCFPLAPYLDHVGPLARDVATCVEAFATLAGRAPARPLDAAAVRVGALRDPDGVEPSIAAAYAAALDRVAEAGAAVARWELLPAPDGALRLFQVAVAHVHRATYPSRADDYGPDVRWRIGLGHEPLQHLDALALADEVEDWKATFARRAEPFDVVASPTVGIPTPAVGCDPRVTFELTRFTRLFNTLGWPAISMPCGRQADGLPVGLQLAGPDDEVVLGAALALEGAIRG
jgi:aspartyl-tRNA(Asn)/glutamyl-tRNA(Gln) amidotransferase subunit A